MSLAAILAICAALAIAVGFVVLIVVLIRQSKKTLGTSDALRVIASSQGVAPQGNGVQFVMNGLYSVQIDHVQGKHARFSIALTPLASTWPAEYVPPDEEAWGEPLRAPHQPLIDFARERAGNRFGKALGLNREVQIGDAEFDRAVYIDTLASDEIVHAVCRRREAREAIAWLLAAGYAHVYVFGHEAPVRVHSVSPPAGIQLNNDHRRHLQAMETLAASLPRLVVAKPGTPPLTPAKAMILLAWGGAVVSAIANGVLSSIWPTFGPGLGSGGVAIGAVLFIVGMIVAVVGVRGRSDSLSMLVALAIALAIGFPNLSAASLRVVNVAFAPRPPVVIDAWVSDTRMVSGKSTSYYVLLNPQGGPNAPDLRPEEFSIDSSTYYALSPGDRIKIRVGHGALGVAWLDEIIVR